MTKRVLAIFIITTLFTGLISVRANTPIPKLTANSDIDNNNIRSKMRNYLHKDIDNNLKEMHLLSSDDSDSFKWTDNFTEFDFGYGEVYAYITLASKISFNLSDNSGTFRRKLISQRVMPNAKFTANLGYFIFDAKEDPNECSQHQGVLYFKKENADQAQEYGDNGTQSDFKRWGIFCDYNNTLSINYTWAGNYYSAIKKYKWIVTSGGMYTLRDGKIHCCYDQNRYIFNTPNSKTMVGFRKRAGEDLDSEVIIVVVDRTINPLESGYIMKKLGCTDAMMFDGGTSLSYVLGQYNSSNTHQKIGDKIGSVIYSN